MKNKKTRKGGKGRKDANEGRNETNEGRNEKNEGRNEINAGREKAWAKRTQKERNEGRKAGRIKNKEHEERKRGK